MSDEGTTEPESALSCRDCLVDARSTAALAVTRRSADDGTVLSGSHRGQ